MKWSHVVGMSGLALLMLAAMPVSGQATTPSPRIIGYFAEWAIYNDTPFLVTDIAADKLTHINYGFAAISDEGEIALLDPWADTQFPYPGDKEEDPLKGNFKQLQLLKQAHPGLETLISIGGWTGSAHFSDVALTDESRAKFARSVVAFILQYGFDGVDLDWEYPAGGGAPGNVERPEDPVNFISLLAELRTQLDTQGKKDNRSYLLTMAIGVGPDTYAPLDWGRISPLVDWVGMMGYDMTGTWSEVTSFNAPLYDTTLALHKDLNDDAGIQGILAGGVPADKLVLGVPFYGYAFSGVGPENNGAFQPYNGVPDYTDGGTIPYRDLAASYIGKFERFWDDQAQVPWLYDAQSQTMMTYDDPQSLTAKTAYVRQQGLGGIMIWELSLDDRSATLLTAVHDGLVQ